MKLLRNALLLLAVAALAFGGGSAAWGADVTLGNDTAPNTSPIGKITFDGTKYIANIYYVGAPANVTFPIVVSGDGFSATETIDDISVLGATDTSPYSGGITVAASTTWDSDYETNLEVALPVLPATTKTITVNVEGSTTTGPTSATLELTFVPVTPSLSIESLGTVASMDFYVGVAATNKALVSAAGLPFASFDLTLSSAPAWAGPTPVANSQDISITTTVAWTTVVPKTSFDVTASKIVILDDNNAVVAGVSSTPVGTFTAQIAAYGLTLTGTPMSLIVGTAVPAETSFDVTVLPNWTSVDITISSDATASDSTATSAIWNRLTVSSNTAARKLEVTGTPLNAGTNTFVVFAKNGTTVLASADFTISVGSLILSPASYSGSVGVPLTPTTVGVSIAGNPSATFSSLTLGAYGSVSENVKGVTVSADQVTFNKIYVEGAPTSSGLATLEVTAVSGGVTYSGVLSFSITATPQLILSPSTLIAVKDMLYTGEVSASVSSGILTDLAVSPTSLNGIGATANQTTHKVTFTGEPMATGSVTFTVTGKVGGVALTPKDVVITTVGTTDIDDMISDYADDWTARVWDSNGKTLFSMSTRIDLPAGISVSDILEIIASFMPGAVYYYNADIEMDDGYAYLKIGGQLYDGATPSDVLLQAIQIIMSNGNGWSQSGIGLTLQQILNAHRSGGGSSGGCSASGLGIAALALCLGALLRKKR